MVLEQISSFDLVHRPQLYVHFLLNGPFLPRYLFLLVAVAPFILRIFAFRYFNFQKLFLGVSPVDKETQFLLPRQLVLKKVLHPTFY